MLSILSIFIFSDLDVTFYLDFLFLGVLITLSIQSIFLGFFHTFYSEYFYFWYLVHTLYLNYPNFVVPCS